MYGMRNLVARGDGLRVINVAGYILKDMPTYHWVPF